MGPELYLFVKRSQIRTMELHTKGSGESDLTRKNSLRKSMYDFINTSFSKDEILDSEWVTLLNFVEQSVKICHDVLVSHARSTNTSVPNYTHAFALWLVQSLFTVVTKATSVRLQDNINSCLNNILNLTKSRDQPMFCYLLKKIVQLVTDLSELYRMSSVPDVLKYPVYMSHFEYTPTKAELEIIAGDTEGVHASPGLVELPSLSHLGAVLRHSVLTLTAFSSDVVMFCPGVIDPVYSALCTTLKFGDLRIKEAALTLLEALVRTCIFASSAAMDNVVWTLIAMVNLCPKLLQGTSVAVDVQQKLSACLRLFFCSFNGEKYAVVRFWDHLSSSLIGFLASKSFTLAATDLQVCVGELLYKCCLMTPALPSFRVDTIVDSIGRVNNLQPLVPTLCLLVRLEITGKNVTKSSSHPSHGEESSKSHTPAVMPLRSHILQKAVFVAGEINNRSLGQLDLENLLCWLEGLRAILEIHSRLCNAESEVWWSAHDLKSMCQCWEHSVNHALFHKDSSLVDGGHYPGLNYIDKVLSVVMDSVGALTHSKEGVKLTAEVTSKLAQLLFLPWPLISKPKGKLKSRGSHSINSELVRQTLQAAANKEDGLQCRHRSLAAVASLCGEEYKEYTKQKLHCFKSAMREGSVFLASVVKSLPLLFVSLSWEDAADIVHNMASNDGFKDPSIQSLFIGEIPVILLALSGCQLKRRCHSEGFWNPAYREYCLDFPPTDCTVSKQLLEWVVQPVMEVSEAHLLTELLKCLSRLKSLFVLEDTSLIDQLFLKWFTHSEPSVLAAISSNVQHLFAKEDNFSSTEEIERHPVIVRLREAYQEGAHSGNLKLQEFTVMAFGQICRFSKDNLFTTCLIRLLKFYLEPSQAIRSAAFVQVQRLAKSLKLLVAKLLSQHKDSICQLVVSLIHEKQDSSVSKKSSIFHQIAKVFEVNLGKFFKITEDVLVPLLVCRATREALLALELLASQLKTSARNLVVNSFKHVFLYMIQRGGQKELQTVSTFLKAMNPVTFVSQQTNSSKNHCPK